MYGMPHITASGDFAFRLIDGSGECIAATTITGPRELGLASAEHQLREHGLPMAALQRQLHNGTWFAVARVEV